MGFMDSVKGIAEKVSGTVESGVKSVTDSTKKMGEKTKVRNEINKLESEIHNAYFIIGKRYFEKHSEAPEEDYIAPISDIKSKTERIEKFKLLLASYEDKQPCSNCGAEVVKGQKFCDKCGTKIEFPEPPIIEGFNDVVQQPVEVVSQTEPLKRFCTNCSAELDPTQKFCDKCGTKIGD
ncbi:MAG TPA: zinc-ribbon domain-containing protein [Ruminococcus sp.]|nr:zinc-ribbon domain-containing protein [Ruminococcus sp.]